MSNESVIGSYESLPDTYTSHEDAPVIHMKQHARKINRRTWLNRLCAIGVACVTASSGGIAGVSYAAMKRDEHVVTTVQAQEMRYLDAQAQDAQQREKDAYIQGHRQGVTDTIASLALLNGITTTDASTAIHTLLSLYAVFVQPIAESSTSLDAMLNGARAARGIASEYGENVDDLSALISIVEYWLANLNTLPGSLGTLSASDLDAGQVYIDALIQKLTELAQ